MKSIYYARHRDDDFFDGVTMTTVPRYKTSGLSGDEWRVSVCLRIYRKGQVLHEEFFRDLQCASAKLPWLLLTLGEMGEFDAVFDRKADELKCFQAGCPELAVSEVRIKETFGPQGQRLHPDEQTYSETRRRFCLRHVQRGDAGREDSDDNHETLSGPTPSQRSRPASDVRPAVFGGTIELGPLDPTP